MLFGSEKDLLLKNLTSKSDKWKYRRYTGMPIRYAGGKSLAVGHVVEHIPNKTKKIISPFMGGGAVEIACAKDLNMEVNSFDIFDILTNYWQTQLSEPEKLAKKIEKWNNDKETYNIVKKRLKLHWDKEKIIKDQINLAAHYWYNHNLSYGPGFLGWISKIHECPKKYKRMIDRVRNFKCPNLTVNHGDFAQVLPNHQKDFLYCDPPYYMGEDSKMFKGIYPQRNFPVHHNNFDHAKLRDILHDHKNGFIVSYNDCETIRQWYKGFKII